MAEPPVDAPAPTPDDPPASAPRILETTLELAERHSWDAVHLHDIARAAGIRLADIGYHFGDKDELADAWFDRADAALLAACEAPGWGALSVVQRLEGALFTWLGALAPHRRLTAEMLRYKLQPEHLHLQALGLARVSRTVQWWREVAWMPAVGWQRELEEVALTAMYLNTFAFWLRDASPGDERTRAWLQRQLKAAEWLAMRLPFTRG
jgi:ubiquinone biosynthesis protein COQ9